jgi:VWFA-related protein
MPRIPSHLPWILAALLLAPPPVVAQEREEDPPSDETFFESIDVSVVNVDVVVTDKSGRRVTGLSRDDFELREDGKPVEVTNFYAVAGDDLAAPEAATAGEEAVTASVPDGQQLYLTLFIDNRNMNSQARNRMIPALKELVTSRLRPDDRLMLASYEGDLKIRQAPTREAAPLIAELDKMSKAGSLGSQTGLDRRMVLHQLNAASLPDQGGSGPGFKIDTAPEEARALVQTIRTQAEREYVQTRTTLATLAQLVDSLSGLPGRKVLLYVGGGMSLRPGETMVRAFLNKYPDLAGDIGVGLFDGFEQDTGRLFEQLVAHANAHRVTFYTMSAPPDISRLSAEWGSNASYTSEVESIERVNIAAPMEALASGTGGLAAFDAFDPSKLIDRIREDLGSYYSLGYVPKIKADGKTHKLQVMTKDRSLKVRHREGFRAQTPAERATSRTLAAMVLGVSQNPLEVALEFEEETKDKKGNPVVSLLVKFPMSKLVLLPQEHVHEGRIKVFVGARDGQGRTSPITEMPVPIRIPNDQLLTALGQTATFRVQVAVREGEQTIAVSVRDELGNSDSTITAKYMAGSKVAARTGA